MPLRSVPRLDGKSELSLFPQEPRTISEHMLINPDIVRTGSVEIELRVLIILSRKMSVKKKSNNVSEN